MRKQNVAVDLGEPPMEKTILAQVIADISAAMKKLSSSGLNRNAILALVKDQSGISKAQVGIVLNCLEELKNHYCR